MRFICLEANANAKIEDLFESLNYEADSIIATDGTALNPIFRLDYNKSNDKITNVNYGYKDLISPALGDIPISLTKMTIAEYAIAIGLTITDNMTDTYSYYWRAGKIQDVVSRLWWTIISEEGLMLVAPIRSDTASEISVMDENVIGHNKLDDSLLIGFLGEPDIDVALDYDTRAVYPVTIDDTLKSRIINKYKSSMDVIIVQTPDDANPLDVVNYDGSSYVVLSKRKLTNYYEKDFYELFCVLEINEEYVFTTADVNTITPVISDIVKIIDANGAVADDLAVFDPANNKLKASGNTIGNGAGQVPLSNGTQNASLNADMIDDYHATDILADGLSRNAVINGGMDIWQRGTTIDNPVQGSYLADRCKLWVLTKTVDATIIVTQYALTNAEMEAIGERLAHALKWANTSAGTASDLRFAQLVEDGARRFYGKTITASMWIKSNINLSFQIIIRPFWNATDYTLYNSPVINYTGGSGWQQVSYTVTLAPSAYAIDDTNKLVVYFYNLSNIYNNACEFYTTGWQLSESTVALPFAPRSQTVELLLCQRYYAKTFSQATAPAQNAGVASSLACVAGTAGNFVIVWNLPAIMRAIPTITTYNPSATNAHARNTIDATDTAVSTTESGDCRVIIKPSSPAAGDTADIMRIHATANAEL